MEEIPSDLELLSTNFELISFNQLLFGVEALIVVFLPFSYGDRNLFTIENLLYDINLRLDEFVNNDLRVICVCKEPPTTMIHWQLDRGLQIETFTDLNLSVASALVGTFDLAEYIKATKNVKMDSFMVCMPAVAVISGTGKLIAKYVAASPDAVQISPDDILHLISRTLKAEESKNAP